MNKSRQHTPRARPFASAVIVVLLVASGIMIAACSTGSSDACDGIIGPVRVLTPTPLTLTLNVGGASQVTASLSGGCPSDDRTVVWTSSDDQVATVDAAGKVKAIGGGSATLTATAVAGQVRTSVAVTVRPRVATTIDARPDVDTLSPLGTRNLSVTIKDQDGAVLPGAPAVWRALTPTLATVTSAGVVSAVASGTATIEVSTPRAGADSLRDTVRILIVPACSLVRPVVFGTTVIGSIDASTCQNLYGYRVANQYSLTATAQAYYSIRLVPTMSMALVPLNISSGLYGLPTADTAITALGVIRAGTFGFLVTAPAQTPGTYTVATQLNPDPRLTCAPTDVTTGVSFQTALTPSCAQRDIRILPALGVGQQVRITATAAGFPVTIELRNFTTAAVIQRASATTAGGVATIAFLNTVARSGALRVSGTGAANDLVTVTIAQ
jgi:hypothetical protein